MYYLELANQGQLPTAPVADLLGLEPVSWNEGEAVLDYEPKKEHTNSVGIIQGGIISTAADAAMSASYLFTLKKGEFYTTLEQKTNFLKPVQEGRLRFMGKVIKRGATIGLVQCEVFDEKNRMVAYATGTFMTLRG